MKSLGPLAAFALAAAVFTTHGEVRDSFDWDWKFARFGPMPDGSWREEPGAPLRAVRASSEEATKGNTADKAIDGDPATRWCAAGGTPGEWLQVDYGRPVDIATLEILWEKDLSYGPQVEISDTGASWKGVETKSASGAGQKQSFAIGSKARFLRVVATKTGQSQWASIAELKAFDSSGAAISPGPAEGAKQVRPSEMAFDDSGWRPLNLPHDWGIEGPFRADLPNETGKLPWAGIGWYRKLFVVPKADEGQRMELLFDGAMSYPTVFVNGEKAGEWAYGYASFTCDITARLKFGATNLVAVRADNPPESSRWYPGGGIYRHVWMVKRQPIHIPTWGVFVSTPDVSGAHATVRVKTRVENQSSATCRITVASTIFDPDGAEVARVELGPQTVVGGTSRDFESDAIVTNPKLWDLKSPTLYSARSSVLVNGDETDRQAVPFGIRTVEWNADKGFLLNGRVVKLNGVCNHHDLGPLGSAVHERALERQLEILRDMGCNAIRTSHNPPAPELLDLCDRMGFVVMDEALDCWKMAKKSNDYHRDFDAWHERDIMNFVARDRNHPSVVLWSAGNEIPEQGNKSLHWVAEELAALFHREDPTRKVVAGCNYAEAAYNGFADGVDVLGYNYKPSLYGEFHRRRPNQPLVSSESSSCVSSRGEYFFPVEQNKGKGFFNYQVSSYDLYAPPWAYKPDLEFEGLDKYTNCAGEFVWTGFDYYGEPTPFNSDRSNLLNFSDPAEKQRLEEQLKQLGGHSPSRSSYFGIIDICGFPKDRFFLYQARWRPDFPMVHILPHWNWPERVGQVTPVHVYTSGDSAELFLNGLSLGRKAKEPLQYRLVWDDVKYEPGELKVVAYKAGKQWSEAELQTTGPAAAVTLHADRSRVKGDGRDLAFITIKVVDAEGRMVPRGRQHVTFTLSGPAEIVGVENGDATSHAPIQANEVTTYNGLALVVLRSERNRPGEARLSCASENLKGGAVELSITPP